MRSFTEKLDEAIFRKAPMMRTTVLEIAMDGEWRSPDKVIQALVSDYLAIAMWEGNANSPFVEPNFLERSRKATLRLTEDEKGRLWVSFPSDREEILL